jgi:arylsulfatase A-like enzyme
MADNTAIIYFSDHGDRHHSPYYLWPMTVLGDAGGIFKTARYLQYPGHNNRGHQTIGNFYLSLLHAAGDQRKQFGDLDLEAADHINQHIPLNEWMA